MSVLWKVRLERSHPLLLQSFQSKKRLHLLYLEDGGKRNREADAAEATAPEGCSQEVYQK